MQDFNLITANNKKEALELLKTFNSKIKVLAGATDITISLKEYRIKPEQLLDINQITELKNICEKDNAVHIGALVSCGELLASQVIRGRLKVLYKGASVFGSPQIRNMATIGGNIVNSSPVADLVPPLFVLDAKLKLENHKGERIVPINDFSFAPGKNIIEHDELLTEVICPIPQDNSVSFFIKLGQRRGLSITKASLAFLGQFNNGIFDNVRIAMGAVAPKVIRAPKTEDFIIGKPVNDSMLTEASKILASEVTPITDIRSTFEYRKNIYLNLLKKMLI